MVHGSEVCSGVGIKDQMATWFRIGDRYEVPFTAPQDKESGRSFGANCSDADGDFRNSPAVARAQRSVFRMTSFALTLRGRRMIDLKREPVRGCRGMEVAKRLKEPKETPPHFHVS